MQAIVTKYIGPTNTKGGRIKASCERGSVTIGFNSCYPEEQDPHRAAVKKLIAKFVAEDLKEYGTPEDKNPWNRPFISGGIDSDMQAHVFVGINTNQRLLEMPEEEANRFDSIVEKIKATDGTIAPLWCSLLCSAIRASKA